MIYNWQQPDWPDFQYDLKEVEDVLFSFVEQIGQMNGILSAVPETTQTDAIVDTMVAEAIKTSEIEGEYLSRQDVVSSIRNGLGLAKRVEKIKDLKAQGAGELMLSVRNSFAAPLDNETLFAWHRMLLGQESGIAVGRWRTHKAPMQIVSGALGKEKIHFEAPPSTQVAKEMKRFIHWFNDTAPGGKEAIAKAPVRAAIAHLYFESIHPFEDGNGRIGRAIAEKALSQTIGRPVLLSLSRTIESDKKSYYEALKQAQRSNEITAWVSYFVYTVLNAQTQASELIGFVLTKTKFFDRFKDQLNERQLKVVKKMLDAGPEGFEGGMSAKKYEAITRASKATATRDLQLLVQLRAFVSDGAGRSTRYNLNL